MNHKDTEHTKKEKQEKYICCNDTKEHEKQACRHDRHLKKSAIVLAEKSNRICKNKSNPKDCVLETPS